MPASTANCELGTNVSPQGLACGDRGGDRCVLGGVRRAADDHPQQSSGALVYVDDYEVGITPISTSFLYYGQRRIRLVKDGYETLTVMQPIPPPSGTTSPALISFPRISCRERFATSGCWSINSYRR